MAYTPENGYNIEKKHSFKQINLLNYLSLKYKISIQHARNKGEYKIGDFFLYGYDKESDTGYEFHGWFFQSCEKCFTNETFNTVLQ